MCATISGDIPEPVSATVRVTPLLPVRQSVLSRLRMKRRRSFSATASIALLIRLLITCRISPSKQVTGFNARSLRSTFTLSRCTQIPESPCRAPKTALKSRILARPCTQRPDKVDGGSWGTCQDLRAVRPRAEARRRCSVGGHLRLARASSLRVAGVRGSRRVLQSLSPLR